MVVSHGVTKNDARWIPIVSGSVRLLDVLPDSAPGLNRRMPQLHSPTPVQIGYKKNGGLSSHWISAKISREGGWRLVQFIPPPAGREGQVKGSSAAKMEQRKWAGATHYSVLLLTTAASLQSRCSTGIVERFIMFIYIATVKLSRDILFSGRVIKTDVVGPEISKGDSFDELSVPSKLRLLP